MVIFPGLGVLLKWATESASLFNAYFQNFLKVTQLHQSNTKISEICIKLTILENDGKFLVFFLKFVAVYKMDLI